MYVKHHTKVRNKRGACILVYLIYVLLIQTFLNFWGRMYTNLFTHKLLKFLTEHRLFCVILFLAYLWTGFRENIGVSTCVEIINQWSAS